LQKRDVTIGLISDTHMPQRWKELPQSVFEAFQSVDFILHAGDVGKLWVLDRLSAAAPVIAVHGNDETDEAVRALPYLQTIAAAGHRIVLTHSHFPDRQEELAFRKNDTWPPKLARLAAFGKQHGADIVIYGHSHIPMTVQFDGVWLINPGAIASGGFLSRQNVQTIARLHLKSGSAPEVEYVDVNQAPEFILASVDLTRGFQMAFSQFSESIADAQLDAELTWLWKEVYPIAPDFMQSILLPLGHECWSRRKDRITIQDIADAMNASSDVPPIILGKLRESPVFRPYFN
jgi:uncharacterized protein